MLRRFALALVPALLLVAAAQLGPAAADGGYTVIDLGSFSGGRSYANGLNNISQVVGYSYLNTGMFHAFLYTSGALNDLGMLGGNNSMANAVSDDSLVVGVADAPPYNLGHAFVWDGTLHDLNPPGQFTFSGAKSINAAGQVVGYVSVSNGFHASLWDGTSARLRGSCSAAHWLSTRQRQPLVTTIATTTSPMWR